MKLIVCGKCFDIRALRGEDYRDFVRCECHNVYGWWEDARKGTMKVFARDRDKAKVLGINNSFLLGAFRAYDLSDERWRELHEQATDAPGYLFDKAHRGCPFVLIGVGNSVDTSWADQPPVAVRPGGPVAMPEPPAEPPPAA